MAEKRNNTSKSAKKGLDRSVQLYAVQCGECFKWRVLPTLEEYEDLRSKFVEDPFYCNKRPGLSCEDAADIEYNSSRTWIIDKPNLPKTPAGFKKGIVLRRDYSRLDILYVAPTGKKLRSSVEMATFLKENPECEGLSMENFSYLQPKIMEDTIPILGML